MKFRLFLFGSIWMMLGFALALMVQTPVSAATCTSNGSGNWSASSTWTNCNGGIPTSSDDVVIASSDTVTLDQDATIASLTVSGTLSFGNDSNARSLTVSGDISIASGASISSPTSSNANHQLTIGGDLTNNGTFNGQPDSNTEIQVTFNKDGDQTVSGSGSTTFSKVTLSKTDASNKVIASMDVTMGSGASDFDPDNGAWEQSAGTLTKTGGSIDIGSNGALIFSGSGNGSVGTTTTTGGSISCSGYFTMTTSGSVTVGIGNNAVKIHNGGAASLTSGTLNINGNLVLQNGSTTTFNGARIKVDPQGSSNLSGASNNVVRMAREAVVTMSSGSITIVDPLAWGTKAELRVQSKSGFAKNFTGGTIYIGDGSSATSGGDGFQIFTATPIYNLTIRDQKGGSNRYAQLSGRPLKLNGSLDIQSGGELRQNDQDVGIEGNWTNNGTFTHNDQKVIFKGTNVQTISGGSTTDFYDMVINSSATVVVPVTNQPQAEDDVDNQGVLRQTRSVSGATSFLNIQSSGGADRYFGMDLNGSVGSTQVDIDGYQDSCPNVPSGSHPVKRCYAITPGSSGSVAATFYYEYGELRASEGQDPASLYVWKDNGDGTWTKITPDSRSACTAGIQCSVTVNSLSLASGTNRYVLANYNPQAVEMAAFEASWTPGGVLVTWETVSEFDLLGFNLYRSGAEAGPWAQVNEALILSPSPGSPEGRAYAWLDATAPAGNAYYRLEWVRPDGEASIAGETQVTGFRPQLPYRSWLPMLW